MAFFTTLSQKLPVLTITITKSLKFQLELFQYLARLLKCLVSGHSGV